MPSRRGTLLGLGGLGLAAIVPTDAATAQRRRRVVTTQTSTVVETHRGKVRGTQDGETIIFKGIPYAAPTDGLLRFHAPRPARSWRGIKDCLAFGPRCPQPDRPRGGLAAGWTEPKEMSETCLSLNIWTQGLRDNRKRPVLVWLHGGGGFSYGSGAASVFDGTRLSSRGDVVVVTLNHRLNVFGFLYLARLGGWEFAESGNAGMLDIVAALRWVHENIALFGGDPQNVTVFGQGGGGAKVTVLMAMPQARGLFQKAIAQSGAQLDALTPEDATRQAQTYLSALGLKPGDTARLMKLPVDALLAGLRTVMHAPGAKPSFGPVVDGIVLPRPPWTPGGPPVSANVPLILGTTGTETTALIGAGAPADFALDAAGLHRRLAAWMPARDIPRVLAGFRRLMPRATPSELFWAITTDRQLRQTMWTLAERKAAQGGAPVWLYELDWTTPVDGGRWGAPHGLDLPLVFDTVAQSAAMVGPAAAAQPMADQMAAAWIAFARSGSPATPANPHWPPFTLADRATFVFDSASRVEADYRGAERRLLASLPPNRVTF